MRGVVNGGKSGRRIAVDDKVPMSDDQRQIRGFKRDEGKVAIDGVMSYIHLKQ